MVIRSNETVVQSGAPKLAVETTRLCKSFGPVEVLTNVSFSIPEGDSRALVGRNGAGKSTLVGMITGVLAPTSGKIRLAGAPAPAPGNRRAWRDRVACVYQKWTIIPTLTVAENLFLNNQPTSGGVIRWSALREKARSVLVDWGLDIEPGLDAWRLTVEQRQIVEIARALLQGSRFIILDEPTAELERREVNRLFDRIRRLQENGVTFCYISHHIEEIYEVCRSATVMRDGEIVADAPLSELPKSKLVAAMVGPGQNMAARRRGSRSSEASKLTLAALEVQALSIGQVVHDVDFAIEPGECLGLAGLATSGKEEIAEALAGLLVPSGGTVLVHGQVVRPGTIIGSRNAGIGYVPRDRHQQGILPQLSVAENVTVTINDTFGPLGFIRPSKQDEKARASIQSLGIILSSPQQPISELSGGNQQKSMMARALASSPKVLVLVSPTQGVDIASKDALFGIVAKAQAEGMAVLIASDDVDELAACDRIHVIFRGRITKTFGTDWLDHDLVAAIEGLDGNVAA